MIHVDKRTRVDGGGEGDGQRADGGKANNELGKLDETLRTSGPRSAPSTPIPIDASGRGLQIISVKRQPTPRQEGDRRATREQGQNDPAP